MLAPSTNIDAPSAVACLRDVVALSTLPAVWSGAEPVRIAESLAAALFTTLMPDLVSVSLGHGGEPPVTAAHTRRGPSPALPASTEALARAWALEHDPEEILPIPDPRGRGTLRATVRPIGHSGERGLIVAAFADEAAPTAVHHLHLGIASTQAAIAMENVRLLRSLRRTVAEREEAAGRERDAREVAETLNEVARTLAGELDLHNLVQSVTDAATRLTGAKFGAFFYNVIDASGGAYMLYTLSGAPREAFERFGLPRATALFGPTFRGEGVVRADDILKHPTYGKSGPPHGMPAGHLPVRSYLAVPVASRSGQVLGGLFFGHPEPGVFTARAERMAVAVAAQAAIAIDNARLFEKAEREIRERTAAEAALRRANDELDRFAAVASHDLKEPLRGIAHLAAFILEDEAGPLSEESRERLRRIQQQCARLTSMVSGLLEFAKAGGEGRTQPCDLGQAAAAALDKMSDALAAGGAEVVIRPGLPTVEGDPLLLERVFANLISNGLRYNDSPVKRVEVSFDGAEVRVKDNGIGIDPRHHEKVFRVFGRLSTDRERAGTGLGLALVKRIMERHGGSVRVESSPGQGSAFFLRFPPAGTEGAGAAVAGRNGPAAPAGRG